MGTLPATGSAISFGRVKAAYTDGAYPRAAGEGVSLGGVLNTYISRGITQTSFSSVFGGRTTPQNYP